MKMKCLLSLLDIPTLLSAYILHSCQFAHFSFKKSKIFSRVFYLSSLVSKLSLSVKLSSKPFEVTNNIHHLFISYYLHFSSHTSSHLNLMITIKGGYFFYFVASDTEIQILSQLAMAEVRQREFCQVT